MAESDTTIWVNVGNAAALVGATLGATAISALAIVKGLENMDDDLLDPDAKALQNGAEALGSGSQQRTRLRAEDVLAAQQQQQLEEPKQPK